MTRPRKVHSVEASTSTGAGDSLPLSGRTGVALQVESDDPTGLELEVQARLDEDSEWAPVYSPDTSDKVLSLAASDLSSGEGQTRDTALVTFHHLAAHEVRAYVTSAPAGNTDVWVAATSLQDTGYTFRDMSGV